MRRMLSCLFFATSLIFSSYSFAQLQANPFACQGIAQDLSKNNGVAALRSVVRNRIQRQPNNAQDFCIIAELMKRVGDYEAEKYYERAIDADTTEPAYELFYATYLRNFRGPQRPLFPDAEQHYFKAWSKLQQRGVPTLGSGQVCLTGERSDCHKRSQAKHPPRGGGHSHDNRRRRI